jgi:hypothetical protein
MLDGRPGQTLVLQGRERDSRIFRSLCGVFKAPLNGDPRITEPSVWNCCKVVKVWQEPLELFDGCPDTHVAGTGRRVKLGR